MKSRFPLGKISAFGKLVTGKTPSSKIEDAFGGDIPFITPRDMDGRRLLETTERYLSQSGVCAVKNSLIPEDSVVVSCIGSDMGKVGVTTKPSVTNQQINAVIVDKEKYLPEYLYYALLPRKSELRASAGGTTMPILNKSNFGEFEIPIPSFDDQLRIVNTVRPLDEKIELNTQMNQTLEKIAQRIFKSWFIDFDPVKANAEGVPFDGLSPDIQSLFPSEFVESEMGLIPKGWDIKPVGDFLSVTIGGDWGKDESDDKHTEPCRIIRGTDLNNVLNGNISAVPLRYVQKNKLAKRKLEIGDIVIEVSGGSPTQPTGRNIRLNAEHLELLDNVVAPASFCRLFRPMNPTASYFLSSHLTYLYNIGGTWEYQNQSTGIANFQTKFFLEDKKIATPPDSLLLAFRSAVEPLFERAGLNSKHINSLSRLRDRLLPKLLSGSIEINTELAEAS